MSLIRKVVNKKQNKITKTYQQLGVCSMFIITMWWMYLYFVFVFRFNNFLTINKHTHINNGLGVPLSEKGIGKLAVKLTETY